jgi:hypothetical protein
MRDEDGLPLRLRGFRRVQLSAGGVLCAFQTLRGQRSRGLHRRERELRSRDPSLRVASLRRVALRHLLRRLRAAERLLTIAAHAVSAVVPEDGSPCGGYTECYYDACPEAGRAIATCSDRVWNVETRTSCAVECSGFGQQCDEGELCLIHAGGAVQIECTPNGCGTGPILAECAGNCPVFFSLAAGATATCNTCPQGGCP